MRLFMNRDETHLREEAESPQLLVPEFGVYGPRDPQGGGTWIAYNQSGYWGCLLNGYFEPSPANDFRERNVKQSAEGSYKERVPESEIALAKARPSRGAILPRLLSADDPLRAIQTFDPRAYASFRLLMGDAQRCVLFEWNGFSYKEVGFHAQLLNKAFFLTSSSWRQDEVVEARSRLFLAWVNANLSLLDELSEIPEYHLDSDLLPSMAPFMWRPESATQSVTSLAALGKEMRMRYHSVAKDLPVSDLLNRPGLSCH